MKAGIVRVVFHTISFALLIVLMGIDVETMGMFRVGFYWMISMLVYDIGNWISEGIDD